MRVRDHVALSTAAAALLYPKLRSRILPAWATSILIDVDHYLWYALRNRTVNPVTAVRHFNSADAPEHSETRLLHHPLVLLALGAVSVFVPAVRMPLVGMTFHVGLDTYHRARVTEARAAARLRDENRCQVCGATEGTLVHLWRQPSLLPTYDVDDFVTVCNRCHEVAHSNRREAIARPETDWDTYLDLTGLRERAVAATSRR